MCERSMVHFGQSLFEMLENLEKETKAAQTKGSLSSGLKNIQTAFVQGKNLLQEPG